MGDHEVDRIVVDDPGRLISVTVAATTPADNVVRGRMGALRRLRRQVSIPTTSRPR
ncbi:MAG TPA: hypothetical protein VE197_22180 [Mycobacterium sp.]|nr:hypothetical protein [Mycobacterium sp.]